MKGQAQLRDLNQKPETETWRTGHRAQEALGSLEGNGQVHQKKVGTPQVEGAYGGMQQVNPLSLTGVHPI